MSRPARRITDHALRRIEILAGLGLPKASVAHVEGVSPRTFRRWQHNPRVLAALEKGRAVAEAKIAEALFKQALRGNVVAAIWLEKTRYRRTDRQILEHTGPNGEPLHPEPIEIRVVYDDLAPIAERDRDELVEVRAVPPRALPAPNGNGHG